MQEELIEKEKNILEETINSIDTEIKEVFGYEAAPGFDSGVVKNDTEQHIVFTLAGTEYAVSVLNIREVGKPLKITPVPNLPSWVLGVSNLRGEIISVLDLRIFLGIESIPYQESKRMLVVHSREQDITTALIVDNVRGIRSLSMEKVNPPASPIGDRVGVYMSGVYEHKKGLFTVIDLECLLKSPEIRQF